MAAGFSDAAVAPLTLRLFGPFEAVAGGRPLTGLYSRKGQRLLAILALRRGRPVERAWLAGTLWPENDEPLALFYLRRELSHLRRALGPESARLQSPSAHTLLLDLDGACVDLLPFDAAMEGRQTDGVEKLEQAVALYRGELLEGWSEEWVLPERERREQAYIGALERLAAAAEARSDPATEVRHLRLLVTADPLRESAHRRLMAALAAGGDHAAAVQVFRDLRRRLRDELNTEPDTETRECFRQVRESARTAASSGQQRESVPQEGAVMDRLPRPPTRIIGRGELLRHTLSCLESGRLVTLTGAGGVGKTRLAVEVAREAAPAYDAAFFVELDAAESPGDVLPAVVTALGVHVGAGQTPRDALVAFAARRSLLIVLDNCEHLLSVCAELAALLLRETERVHLLATSRQSLGVSGERALPVPPLSVPEDDSRGAADKDRASVLLEYDAVQLFVDRAAQARPDLTLAPRAIRAAATICRQLDGIPLAIELAAARLRAMSIEELAARMSDAFRLLTHGSRTAPARQQTLRQTIEWSWRLLADAERHLLRRLAVFVGGWTLEAAEAICDCSSTTIENRKSKIENQDVLDLLLDLVDKSLVVCAEAGGQSRYRMLETVRQFVWEQAPPEERAVIGRLHADYFTGLLSRIHRDLHGADRAAWLDRIERDLGNLGRVLEFHIAAGEPVLAQRLTWHLGAVWTYRGRLIEGRQWITRALAVPGDPQTRDRAGALKVLGTIAFDQADFREAGRCYEESAAIFDAIRDRANAASLRNDLGRVAHRQGDYTLARQRFEEALRTNQDMGQDFCAAINQANLGLVAMDEGDYAAARDALERAVRTERALGMEPAVAGLLTRLGTVALRAGDSDRARSLFEEGLLIQRQQGDRYYEAASLEGLAEIACREHDLLVARARLNECLALQSGLMDRAGLAGALTVAARIALDEARPRDAAELLGGVEALRADTGGALSAYESEQHGALLCRARAELPADAFASLHSLGTTWTVEQLVALAES